MIETLVEQDRAVAGMRGDVRIGGWKAELRSDLDETFRRGGGRWARAMGAVAWLFTPRLFILAVQMYFTALLMVRFPDQENLIYGVSWWLALLAIAWRIRRRERPARPRTSGFPA